MIVPIVFFVIAPVLQIVFCSVRISRQGKLPIAIITFFCVLLGTGLSIVGGKLIDDELVASMPSGKCLDCGMVGVAYAFVGLCVSIVFLPIIGLIASAIYSSKRREVALNQN